MPPNLQKPGEKNDDHVGSFRKEQKKGPEKVFGMQKWIEV
jgi:hypothetical protein